MAQTEAQRRAALKYRKSKTRTISVTLYPADFYAPGKLALIVLADSPELIADAWRPLLTPAALTGDYLLFRPDESAPRASGWCTPDWEVEE